MKKRKILYLFPLAALVLSGCTFQEGWETAKNWTNDKVFTPVVQFFKDILGIEDKKEEKKDDEPSGGEQGGGEQGGGGGQQQGGGAIDTYGTEHEGTENDPLTGADALLIASQLGDGEVPEESFFIKDEVEEITDAFNPQYGNFTFKLTGGFLCYRLKFGPNYKSFTSANDIEVGDTVTVYAQIQNYYGNTPETKGGYVAKIEKPAIDAELVSIEITGNPVTSYISGQSYTYDGLKLMATYDNDQTQDVTLQATWAISKATAEVGDTSISITASFGNMSTSISVDVTVQDSSHTEHAGTEADPFSGADACIIASGLENKTPTEESYYIKGVVESFEETFNPTYGNFSFKIDGGFIGWRLKGPNNTAFTSADDLEIGDTVTMYAKIQNYDGKPETSGGNIVEIVKPAVAVESVVLSEETLALEVGEQATLSATVNPAKASQEVTWEVDSGNSAVPVASCENGKVIALAVGTAVVTATSVADPTKSASCEVTVTEATKELLSLAFSGTPTKTEYVEGDEYDPTGLKVMAHYSVGDDEDVTENATIVANKQYAEYGDTEVTFTASYGVLDVSQSFSVTVDIKKGSEAHPYTIAEARDAIDNNGDKTGVYATGIVSEIVTAFSSEYKNVSFNISADGTKTADQLQAYRCVAASEDDVAVGDTVTVKGNLKKYNSTYEFDAGCTIEARVQPTVVSVAISGTPAQTEYGVGDSYNHNGLVATATLSNGGQVDVTSAAVWTPSKATAEQGDEEITYTATYGGVESAAFPIEVTISSSPVVVPGSEEQPYTTAQARDAIDNNGNKTGVYTAGIVNRIAYAYSTSSKNMSFYFSDDGSTTNEVEAYKLAADTDPNVEVGDYVVVYGDLTKYNSTYEVNTGCTLATHTKATVQSVTISGTASQTEYAVGASYNHNGLTATAHLSTNVDVDVTDKATWNFDPATASLDDESVSITATYGGVTSAATVVNVTVTSSTPAVQTYAKTTSIAVGDKIAIACEGSSMYLTSISTTSTKYGVGSEIPSSFTTSSYELTVVAGSEANTFAFKTSDNKYLCWTSGNSLNVSDTLNANSSWDVSISSSGDATILNHADSARQIWWNVSSPRFACYTGKSNGDGYKITQIYKLG